MSAYYYCKYISLVCSACLVEVYYIMYLGIVEPTCNPSPWELEIRWDRSSRSTPST